MNSGLTKWDIFQQDFVEVNKITAKMSAVGIGIDNEARLKMQVFYESLEQAAISKLQDLVPDHLKPVHPVRGYKKVPKDTTGMRLISVKDIVRNKDGRLEQEIFERWAQVKPFNPQSPQQVLAYIRWKYGAGAVPRNKKKGTPSTERDQLERLAKKHNDAVLLVCLAATEAGDKVNNFLRNFEPAADGRLHCEFTNNPATFRFSTKNPNTQNLPREDDNGDDETQILRSMIVPGEGYEYLVSRDYTGIEAIIAGWLANDPDYMRLARLGVHSYFAARLMGIPANLDLPDSVLSLQLALAKRQAQEEGKYEKAKRIVHGTNYGMTPRMLQQSYSHLFSTTKAAAEAQEQYFSLFPKIKHQQNAVIERAFKECYIESPRGYRRWFWHVKKLVHKGGKWVWDWADDAKKVIATQPQGQAASIIRRAMVQPQWKALVDEGLGFLQIHDELLARARNYEHALEVGEQMRQAMEFPVPEMDGMVFGTTMKIGKTWASMI